MADDSLFDDIAPSRGRSRRALGRGLDALLPASEAGGLREVDIDCIEPNPLQPRQRFERAALEELSSSIREHGVLQPLVVSAHEGNRFRLIVGERRWQAARLAGLRQVPVIVKEAGDLNSLEIALVENVQRADLNPLEEATAYQRLVQDFGLTQAKVAQRVGKSRVTVTNTLRLLGLPEATKRALIEERISEGHGRALAGISDLQLHVAALDRILNEGLTVRQTEALVRSLLERPTERAPRKSSDPEVEALEDALRRALGTRVSVRPGKRGGRMVIEWYSDEEFQGLYRKLIGED